MIILPLLISEVLTLFCGPAVQETFSMDKKVKMLSVELV